MKQEADNSANRMQNKSDRELTQSTDTVPGEFVTETFDYGGGQRISKWGRSLEQASTMSTMIVGVQADR